MVPVKSAPLCARQKSSFVKEANEDANYRAGYFLVPFALALYNTEQVDWDDYNGEGGGLCRKAEVHISGRMLPRWDVEMARVAYPSYSPLGFPVNLRTTAESKESFVLIIPVYSSFS